MSFLDIMRRKNAVREFKPDPNAERLVSVAIQRDGEVHSRGFKSHYALRAALGDKFPQQHHPDDVEGFMTSEGRFVDRHDAKHIAVNSGQIPPSWQKSGRRLLSSDIDRW
jgi:hypothetical protein